MPSCYHPDEINPFSRVPAWQPVFVDGFRPVRQDIDALLTASIDAHKPIFVLIAGESGTGRSAAAKYVLDRYHALCGVAADHFVVPDFQVTQYGARLILGKWLQRLGKEAKAFTTDLNLATDMQTTVAQAQDAIYENLFASIVERYAADMTQQQAAFGALFENVLAHELVTAAKPVFEDVVAPCVFTLGQQQEAAPKIHAAFDALTNVRRAKIELSYITGDEVAQFAHEHWVACHPNGEPGPFERDAVREVFSDRPRSIATARTLLARLHAIKIALQNELPPWNAAKIAEILPQVLTGDKQ